MEEQYKHYTITLQLLDGRKYPIPIAVPYGPKGKTGEKGEKGEDGKPITIVSVVESPLEEGANVVTFSDGTVLTVRNGSRGKDGINGESIKIVSVTESDSDDGMNEIVFSDGTAFSIKNGSKGKDGRDGKTAYQYAQEGGFGGSESEFASHIAREIPTKVSQLDNDSGFLTSIPSEYVTETELTAKKYLTDVPSEYVTESELDAKKYLTQESDPTVPSWAKQPTKPTYTAEEVGARPEEWMPTAEQVGAHPSTWMPSAEDVGARPSTWMPTYSDVGAEKSGTADTKVATHNTNGAAHNDIRLLIEGLTTRLNALANSDDTTLDQMKEVVDYIKANRDLIEEITTNKISYSDIVNNLTTNVSSKPLSAAQGVALKALIDAITIPTKVSELTNDAGYLKSYTETDPTVPSWAKASSKPTYTKSEVGLGNVENVKQYSANNPPPYPVTSVNGETGKVTVSVPSKTSQLTNDSGFLTSYTESDPTVPSWAKASKKPSYTAEEVGAVSSNALEDAINVALATAKESGEFDGKDGEDGEDGYTPVKGTDYYTEADKAEMVNAVIAGLPKYDGGVS